MMTVFRLRFKEGFSWPVGRERIETDDTYEVFYGPKWFLLACGPGAD